ncbi:MAG: N-methylhydantoinase A/acetone carboxylase subunit beta [Gammaproteobacteria bacterium]|nr:N-methylhydantoinase A/acetone carboxylase subunit beta [Gammaproteobacteria bacterium]
MFLGIDTGGTFTDFVYYDGRTLTTHKVLSTPAAPEQAILQGIREMNLNLSGLRVIHGSTVATNAVLEGKGAKVAYITNRGLRDVLSIGRQARRELYNLMPAFMPPPVPDDYLLETGGRLSAQGEVVEDLTEADLQRLVEQVQDLRAEAVAINLLFAFLDNRYERHIAAALPEHLFVSCSADILCEYREYERGITTWLNAYVGPLVHGYLTSLTRQLAPAQLSVMRSSGDTCAGALAGREAVHLILSGPAGGLAGARFVANAIGLERIMTFDMGGTSTDVALIDGAIELTNQGRIAHYPVAVPMVDMHTIGAGGGSIAYVDTGGMLQVGPVSAGADPGPVCYGRGGKQVTVTDANLVLGRLPKTARLGGNLTLDFEVAHTALTALAARLGLESAETAALGVVRLANEHMAQALRVISVQRGIDPRQFTLVAFGGAGGLHVCDLADDMEITQILAPILAGVLSALGMLVAPPGRQLTRTLARLLHDCNDVEIHLGLEQLAQAGRSSLAAEGVNVAQLILKPSLDLCYRGQAYPLTIPWTDNNTAEQQFHIAHEQRYGHRLDAPVEIVNLRLGLRGPGIDLPLPELEVSNCARPGAGLVYGCPHPVPIRQRAHIPNAVDLPGPLLVCDTVATTYVAPGWHCRRDKFGNLLINKY